ncbi:hypothetical protein [Paracoccus luteus]|nr:hypothetical protein [Paracoccus luteus]
MKRVIRGNDGTLADSHAIVMSAAGAGMAAAPAVTEGFAGPTRLIEDCSA